MVRVVYSSCVCGLSHCHNNAKYRNFDFSPAGVLGKFDQYFSNIKPSDRDSFLPRDFLYFNEEKQGMVWIWALSEGMDDDGNEVIDFEGGYYLTFAYKAGDEETNGKLYSEALKVKTLKTTLVSVKIW